MNFALSPEITTFRREVREFLREHLLHDMARRGWMDFHPAPAVDRKAWLQLLRRRGWSVPHWPVDWSGTGWTPLQHRIFELIAHHETDPKGHPLIEVPTFRRKLVRLEMDLMDLNALERSVLRVLCESPDARPGGDALSVASALKVRGSELQQRATELPLAALGDKALCH